MQLEGISSTSVHVRGWDPEEVRQAIKLITFLEFVSQIRYIPPFSSLKYAHVSLSHLLWMGPMHGGLPEWMVNSLFVVFHYFFYCRFDVGLVWSALHEELEVYCHQEFTHF